MSAHNPTGAAKEVFLRGTVAEGPRAGASERSKPDDDFEASYLGWEVARCASGLAPDEELALSALAAACIAALKAGTTRIPLDRPRLASALANVGAEASVAVALSLLEQGRKGEGPAAAVIGIPGQRKPLVVDGEWLSTERMCRLEERLCDRIQRRVSTPLVDADARRVVRAVAAVAAGPPPLTDEQKRALRSALGPASVALISGGPGTGKTTIVVALLRALAWQGVAMESIAIAAPTGRAAHRLEEAIARGLASATQDIGESALRIAAPVPQTLHRLLGWSPARGRFARHENDPLPHRVVIADEASMIDLAMMDRLVRSLSSGARLILLGDADQLPSVEAGAVFRDLCAALGGSKLGANLRVARDPGAKRIVVAAQAVNEGTLDSRFATAVAKHSRVDGLAFEGVEHLDARWSEVSAAFLTQWWERRVADGEGFARRASRTYRMRDGAIDPDDRADLTALLQEYGRARLLGAIRAYGPASTEAINAELLARLEARPSFARGRRRGSDFAPGTPVIAQRNDYTRQLYNGDQGVVVRVDRDGAGPTRMALFARGSAFDAFAVDAANELTTGFAMTVHKAQGSEFDHVALVLPEVDLPLLTRELVYTAITRARRSVTIVGPEAILARAVGRSMERYSGIVKRLQAKSF